MSRKHFKISKGISISPVTAQPADAENGDLIYNSSTSQFEKYENGAWTSLGSVELPTSSNLIQNLGISTSVSGGALIINVTQKDGSTPTTGAGAVTVAMRNSTLTNGTYNVRQITGALSFSLQSSLGHTSGVDHPIWVYLIDNSGTLEIAVSHVLVKREVGIITTLAEGGGSADSNTEMYSTTARTGVPFVLIGKLIINQPTAGIITNNVSKIILNPTEDDPILTSVWTSAGQTINNNTTVKITLNNVDVDDHGCFDVSDSVFTQPRDGEVEIEGFVHVSLPGTASGSIIARVYADGNLLKEEYLTTSVGNLYPARISIKSNSSRGVVWDFRVYQISGTTMTVAVNPYHSQVTFKMK